MDSSTAPGSSDDLIILNMWLPTQPLNLMQECNLVSVDRMPANPQKMVFMSTQEIDVTPIPALVTVISSTLLSPLLPIVHGSRFLFLSAILRSFLPFLYRVRHPWNRCLWSSRRHGSAADFLFLRWVSYRVLFLWVGGCSLIGIEHNLGAAHPCFAAGFRFNDGI
ncbi:hypothetical protein BS78_02G299300 [Paspalum vaginatum]|nr:hypothetical protein BS78_02G299300 [Paspalum vaginatum]KAJ1291191.1 hypothetical protein BS78_02G299300 [Paspalum vaginatum]KAJ1291192.1 hypothetical protein BS78_02G299300 [Paspalum vaginatum]